MALTHLLDTTVFSQPVKDRPLETVMSRWSHIGDAAVCTSAICLAEVRQGLEERQSEKYWRRFRELLDQKYVVLPFDALAAERFGTTSAAQRRVGKSTPQVDLLIAATALAHGLRLVTLNTADFTGIPDLAVEDWTQ
jgi:tRNA(fMet)-specific endonuclease VapC